MSESIGAARNWRPNSDFPVVGGVVIMESKPDGHVALVLAVEESRIYIKEANHKPCQISERWIDLSNDNIIGFWVNK